ncbi:MAG: S-methyl-5-thioribose-1-phosphate isomerase, partial [Methylophilaceae bacterium]
MNVNGQQFRSIWPDLNSQSVEIIDQTGLPHAFRVLRIEGLISMANAIQSMQVRGAPLIGASAAYGIALAMNEDNTDSGLASAAKALNASRPTAVNLRWA